MLVEVSCGSYVEELIPNIRRPTAFFWQFPYFFNFNLMFSLTNPVLKGHLPLCPSDLLLILVLFLRSLASITQQLGFQLDEAAMFAERMSMKKNKYTWPNSASCFSILWMGYIAILVAERCCITTLPFLA